MIDSPTCTAGVASRNWELCGELATALSKYGCVHEHITESAYCEYHADSVARCRPCRLAGFPTKKVLISRRDLVLQ